LKYDLRTTLVIIALFFFSQIAGLFIVNKNIETFGTAAFEPSGEEEKVIISLPASIIILTVVFILLHKLGLKNILLLWYSLAFITTVFFSLSAFMQEIYAVTIATVLLIIKFCSKDEYIHNIAELFVYGGLTVVFLPLLTPKIMIILLILISAYDIYSVFYSKHMIVLAKNQESLNIFSGLKVRVDDNVSMLGGGDMAFPLMFASVMLRDYGALHGLLIVYGAVIGLLTLILLSKKNKFYPAMPLITAGCFFGYAASLISFF